MHESVHSFRAYLGATRAALQASDYDISCEWRHALGPAAALVLYTAAVQGCPSLDCNNCKLP